MREFRIEDEFQAYTFAGEVIGGPVSTRDPDAPGSSGAPRARWFEATLYRKDAGGYVLHTVNCSLVWHLPDGAGHVRMPASAPSGHLTSYAVYCGDLPPRDGREQCPPGARRPPRVLTEQPQVKVVTYPRWQDVVRGVSVVGRADGTVSAAMSQPMRELLAQAARNDPAFRGARKPVVPL